MDIDRYVAANSGGWDRLEELSNRARRRIAQLSPAELDEMVTLYQRTSSQLAHVRTQFDDVPLVNRLSRVLGQARGVIYRKRAHPGRSAARFFSESFPAAVWISRRFILVSAALTFVPALAFGLWLGGNPDARAARIDPALQRTIVQSEFADYYRSDAAASFQTEITTNNIRVGFTAFASGVLVGVPTVILLVTNGLHIGEMGAVMTAAGKGSEFWGLITPHGLLELTSIVIAGAAGLRLGWALISPGDRTRGAALAEEGTRSVILVLGLALSFVVAGFIEAWVTPSGLPTAARIAVGVAVEVLFLTYVIGMGRNAVARGATGRFGEVRSESSATGLRASRST